MIYETIPEKYLVSNSLMLFIDIIAGSQVIERWREILLEKLETPKNDNYAVMIGKQINNATAFLSKGDISFDNIYQSMQAKDPDFGGKLIKLLEKDTLEIKVDEWFEYLENCYNQETNQSFFDAFIKKYNKIFRQLMQELDDDNLEPGHTRMNGTLNPEVIF